MDVVPASFTCARCGEANETFVDPSQGRHQSYVEDCRVCCCPNVLDVVVDGESASIASEIEGE